MFSPFERKKEWARCLPENGRLRRGGKVKHFNSIWGLVVCVVLGLTFSCLGIYGVVQELTLRWSGKETTATAIDFRTYKGRYSGMSYQVQYVFSLPKNDKEVFRQKRWFPFEDNIWSSLPLDEWNEVQTTRKVDVLYLPGQPWVTRPKSFVRDPLLDIGAALGIGVLSLLVAGSEALHYVLKRKRALTGT